MQETKFKIDDDLVEYLNAKQDAGKIVNDIIRNMKANEEESLKKDAVKADEHSCEVQGSEKELKPADMSPKKVLLFMILFTIGMILLVSMVKSCSNTKPVKNNPVEFSWSDTDSVATAPEETPVKKNVENKISWDFNFDTDKMTSSKNVWASILSDNSIDLDPPYHSANAKITVRYMKKFGGYDAIISITDGQIYGNEYSNDNYILARFDNGQPIKYWFNEPSDGSSESIFIRRKSDFIAHCKKAKDIKIEIPIFEGGRPIFEFHVDEPLKWKSE